ncbi:MULTISPECIES: 3-oxoacyl-ACP synthase III family protein [unclassified Carboxylicivirga]|uniref:3-oxoacyl-ACP synthase III family protein n=1 Tax=Carboxylicivirga TaxID=1628153 RepID=UPI003D32B39C
MENKHVGLISLGGYLPAKQLKENQAEKLVQYLRKHTQLHPDYISDIERSGQLPGTIETNYDGWESKPWYEAWVKSLPEKKRSNPFQGTTERRRVPLDPISVKESVVPHPMLPSDAETIAGALAIINAGIDPDEIDLVLSHSQVPDRPLPTNASLIQEKLGLRNAGAYSIDTCCSTFVTMMEVATALVKTGIKKKVLIVSSILDSIINDKSTYWSVDTGDAALAGIITNVDEGEGYLSSFSNSHGDRHDGVVFTERSPMLFKRAELGSDCKQHFVTFLNQDALKSIAKNAPSDLKYAVDQTLNKINYQIDNIDFFVTHQPVAWAGNAWREAINIPEDKFFQTFEKYANIATCSAGVNLLEAIENGRIKAGDNVLIASSGAGENHIALVMKIPAQLITNCQ